MSRDRMTVSEMLLVELVKAIDEETSNREEGALPPSPRCLDCTSGTAPNPTKRCAYHEATRWLDRIGAWRRITRAGRV